MQNYGVTSLIGGVTPGTHSSDVFYMNHAGEKVHAQRRCPQRPQHHPSHPEDRRFQRYDRRWPEHHLPARGRKDDRHEPRQRLQPAEQRRLVWRARGPRGRLRARGVHHDLQAQHGQQHRLRHLRHEHGEVAHRRPVRDVEPGTAVLGVRRPRAGKLRAEHHPLWVVGPVLLQEPVEHDQQGHHPGLRPGRQLDRSGLNAARRSC